MRRASRRSRPAVTLDLGALSATLAAAGPLAYLKLDISARLGDVAASLSGRFDGVKGRPAAEGELRLAAPTLGVLARAFGGDLAPELVNKGKVSVVAPITARDTGYAVPALAISAGDISISGSAEVLRTDGLRPFAKVDLEGNTLPWIAGLDLPADPRLAAAPTSGFLPIAAPTAGKASAWGAPLRGFRQGHSRSRRRNPRCRSALHLDNLKEAPPLGIKLAGAWAAPRVVFDTNAFQQNVLKKGLGDFLKSLSKPQSGGAARAPPRLSPRTCCAKSSRRSRSRAAVAASAASPARRAARGRATRPKG